MIENKIKEKYNAIDILKIFLAFNIIQIHSSFYFDWMKPIIRIAVPLFFIISSFFFFKKQPDAHYLWRYIKRLLLLYLFWFIVWSPYYLYSNRHVFLPFSFNGCLYFVKDFLFSSTFAASWYIMASIIGTVIVWLLNKLCNKQALFAIGLLIYTTVVLGTSFHDFFPTSFGRIDDLYYSFTNTHLSVSFPVAIVWIIIGLFLSRENVLFTMKWRYLCLFVVFLSLLEIEYYLSKSVFVCDDSFLMLIPVSITLFYLTNCFNAKFNMDTGILRKISTITYCSHYTIISLCGTILVMTCNTCNIEMSSFWKMFVAVVGSCVLSYLILHFEGKKYCSFLKYSH